MPISRNQKENIVAKVKDISDSAKTMVFVNFHKLPVKEEVQIRKSLRNESVGFYVAKKTLVRKALDSKKYEGEFPQLDGEIAIAYGEDLLAPARSVLEFQKQFDGRVSIVGGIFDNVYKNKEEMQVIASIPSRQTLYAQFVNLINSPIQRVVVALNAIAEKKA
jgi:large subunit ribosomal protein L10